MASYGQGSGSDDFGDGDIVASYGQGSGSDDFGDGDIVAFHGAFTENNFIAYNVSKVILPDGNLVTNAEVNFPVYLSGNNFGNEPFVQVVVADNVNIPVNGDIVMFPTGANILLVNVGHLNFKDDPNASGFKDDLGENNESENITGVIPGMNLVFERLGFFFEGLLSDLFGFTINNNISEPLKNHGVAGEDFGGGTIAGAESYNDVVDYIMDQRGWNGRDEEPATKETVAAILAFPLGLSLSNEYSTYTDLFVTEGYYKNNESLSAITPYFLAGYETRVNAPRNEVYYENAIVDYNFSSVRFLGKTLYGSLDIKEAVTLLVLRMNGENYSHYSTFFNP